MLYNVKLLRSAVKAFKQCVPRKHFSLTIYSVIFFITDCFKFLSFYLISYLPCMHGMDWLYSNNLVCILPLDLRE